LSFVSQSDHYPQKVTSREAGIARLFAVGISLIAVIISGWYAWQIYKLHLDFCVNIKRFVICESTLTIE